MLLVESRVTLSLHCSCKTPLTIDGAHITVSDVDIGVLCYCRHSRASHLPLSCCTRRVQGHSGPCVISDYISSHVKMPSFMPHRCRKLIAIQVTDLLLSQRKTLTQTQPMPFASLKLNKKYPSHFCSVDFINHVQPQSSLERFFTSIAGAGLCVLYSNSRNAADAFPSLKQANLPSEKIEPQSKFPSL